MQEIFDFCAIYNLTKTIIQTSNSTYQNTHIQEKKKTGKKKFQQVKSQKHKTEKIKKRKCLIQLSKNNDINCSGGQIEDKNDLNYYLNHISGNNNIPLVFEKKLKQSKSPRKIVEDNQSNYQTFGHSNINTSKLNYLNFNQKLNKNESRGRGILTDRPIYNNELNNFRMYTVQQPFTQDEQLLQVKSNSPPSSRLVGVSQNRLNIIAQSSASSKKHINKIQDSPLRKESKQYNVSIFQHFDFSPDIEQKKDACDQNQEVLLEDFIDFQPTTIQQGNPNKVFNFQNTQILFEREDMEQASKQNRRIKSIDFQDKVKINYHPLDKWKKKQKDSSIIVKGKHEKIDLKVFKSSSPLLIKGKVKNFC